MFLKLMYITNDLNVALIAQKYGVDRVWIDLETLDKEQRQKGLDVVKSHHAVDDISKIKPHLSTSEMLVRINHWCDGSLDEIEAVIAAGADVIMLPYWKTVEEVDKFVEAVNGRCKTTLLLETKEAVECVDEVLALGGFDEIHIGLNDLHLSYGMTFMFEPLANGTVECLCKKFRASGLPYGFGGIARLGQGDLQAEKIIKEHFRLGSTRAILSRSFCDNIDKNNDLAIVDRLFDYEMKRLRMFEEGVETLPETDLLRNKAEVKQLVGQIVDNKRNR